MRNAKTAACEAVGYSARCSRSQTATDVAIGSLREQSEPNESAQQLVLLKSERNVASNQPRYSI